MTHPGEQTSAPAHRFRILFRGRLGGEEIKVLSDELGFAAWGDFKNYFDPYQGGESRGARATHGDIKMWFSAVGSPCDVYAIEATGPHDGDMRQLETKVRSVVVRIAEVIEPPGDEADLFLFVAHDGRPAGDLYRLSCTSPPQLQHWRRGQWVEANRQLYWVLAGRVGIEIDSRAAQNVAAELTREWDADDRGEIYRPQIRPDA